MTPFGHHTGGLKGGPALEAASATILRQSPAWGRGGGGGELPGAPGEPENYWATASVSRWALKTGPHGASPESVRWSTRPRDRFRANKGMHDRGPDFGSRAVQTAWDGGRTRAKIARAPPGQIIMNKEAIVLAWDTLVGKNNTASMSSKLGVDGSRTEDDKRGEDKKAGATSVVVIRPRACSNKRASASVCGVDDLGGAPS